MRAAMMSCVTDDECEPCRTWRGVVRAIESGTDAVAGTTWSASGYWVKRPR